MSFIARRALIVISLLAVTPTVWAQSIAGTVKDDSGGVLPGVAVEAASPALIEKVRTVVTDGAGQYKIVELRTGTYTVTFSLPGFARVQRTGIELTTDFTANVNAELKVGGIEETITVSGASPLVDVQSVSTQRVITRDVIDALPTGHNIQAAAVLIPGVTSSGGATSGGRDVGGNTMLQQATPNFHGSTQSMQLWAGYWLSNVQGSGTGGATSFYVNDSGTQELSYTTGADSIDVPINGIAVNMIPKDGGNEYHGLLFADYTHLPWSASNLTPALKATGLTNVSRVYHISDFNPGLGGPIKKDKLWFYAAYRYQVLDLSIVNSYYDADPRQHVYTPDLTRPGRDDGTIPNSSVRLLWQVSSKDKLSGWNTAQFKKRNHFSLITGIVPDALALQKTPYAHASTVTWQRTQTSKLLLEAGFAVGHTMYQEHYRPENAGLVAYNDISSGQCYNNYCPGHSEHRGHMEDYKASGTYVTGSHALKAGLYVGHGVTNLPIDYNGDATLNFSNGVPQSAVLRIPINPWDRYSPDLGLYVQDRWTIKRATMTGGLRYDALTETTLDSTLPASRWNASQSFTGHDVVHWKNLSPRVGIAYDLFGDGKTAVKSNLARYVNADNANTANTNDPQRTIGITDTRTWTDSNGDFTIYNANGTVQLNELGPTTNANFGKVIPTTSTQDPTTLDGFGKRGYSWEYQASVQHQLADRVALTGGYYFRWLGNQLATQNTLVSAASYNGPFCITAPSNPNLPGGGGYQVCGLYDISTTALGKVQNNVTFASNFGGITDHYMGFDLGMNARFGRGGFLQGGINEQRRVFDSCNAPILSGTTISQVGSPEAVFCHQSLPYRPDVKFITSYPLPLDTVISATYQLSTGPNVLATWNAPNSLVAPALGRNLATCPASGTCSATKSIQLIEPGTVYAKYLNQLDLRFSKRIQIRAVRLRGDLNFYNVFNSDFAGTVNTTFSTAANSQFLRPTAVIQGRLFKIGGQIDF
jgi:Carboxypeptidase regulatory-like domain